MADPLGHELAPAAHGHWAPTARADQRDNLTREEAQADMIHYIEDFYDQRRLQSSIGDCTPAQSGASPLTVGCAERMRLSLLARCLCEH